MPYLIQRSNGANLVEIADRSIDATTTDLYLVGRGAVNYGQPFTENFVRLLENFANLTPPIKPLGGQLWYDTATKLLKVFNGVEWKSVADQGLGLQPVEVRDLLKVADGSGSGIDSDLLDGHHAEDFLLNSAIPTDFDWSLTAFAKLAGATFTGDVAIASSGPNRLTLGGNQDFAATLTLSASAEQDRVIAFATDGVHRWLARCDTTPETGGNAGSNFRLVSRDDTGAGLATVLFAERATGDIGMGSTSPSANLHVARPGQATFKVQNTAQGVSATIEATDTRVRFGSYTGHPLVLIQNNTAALTLDGTTATFSTGTVVNGNQTVNGTLRVNTANAATVLDAASSTVRFGTTTDHALALATNGTTALTLSRSGNATFAAAATITGDATFKANATVTGQLQVGGATISSWNASTAADVAVLIPGSDAGALIRGPNSAHVVVAIGSNDSNDGFHVVSKSATGNTTVTAPFDVHLLQVTNSHLTYKGNDIWHEGNDAPLAKLAGAVFTGDISAPRLRLTGTNDVSANSTLHAFQVGPDTGANLCLDQNEMQARANGAVSGMTLNAEGGNVTLGNANSTVYVPGLLKVYRDITNGHGEYVAFDTENNAVSLWVNEQERLKVMASEAQFDGHTILHEGNYLNYLASSDYVYVSSLTTIVNGGNYTFNHGFGTIPAHVQVELHCITADMGYAVGDVIQIAPGADPAGATEGVSIVKTAGQVIIRIGANGPTVYIAKTNGGGDSLAAARWKMVIRAYKY